MLRRISLVCLLGLLFASSTAGASGTIFFTGTNPGQIWRGDTEGAVPVVTIHTRDGWGSPVGITESQGELFWGTGEGQTVEFANSDGSGSIGSLPNSAVGYEHHDVAVDRSNDRYFFTGSDSGLFVASLDGAGSATNIYAGLITTSVAYDTTNDWVYFSEFNKFNRNSGHVYRARPDGDELTELFSGLNDIRDIALDVDGGRIFYVDLDTVGVVNLDGSGSPTTLFDPAGKVRSIDFDASS